MLSEKLMETLQQIKVYYMETFAAKCPPSDTRLEPVVNEDTSDAKNRMAFAMSSLSPILPTGSFSPNFSIIGCIAFMSHPIAVPKLVFTAPGLAN